LFCWSSSALLLLLAVMSILAVADCAACDRMLPSRSHLKNGLGRRVQHCNSNEGTSTCGDITQADARLHSSALDHHTTAPRHQPLPVNGCGGRMQGGERSSQMLCKH